MDSPASPALPWIAAGGYTLRVKRAIPLILLAGCATFQPEPEKAQILKVLTDQADAWNRGDLEGFLAGYRRSDEIVFAGGGDVHRGFDAMAARYRKAYGSREKMGTLAFSNLAFESIESDRAVVTGSWDLQRAGDKPGGVFTLILRKYPEGWRIVHDHTSSR
jgi:ketosteroid isomerase-like protein